MTQVGVMKPETGNWSILTHDRSRGVIDSVGWSTNGALIYYDRLIDVPQGIYSVPVLGGEERLILENAFSPAPLPDGTMLALTLNADRRAQLLRFWPDTGRSQVLPVLADFKEGEFRFIYPFPNTADAVTLGWVSGHQSEPSRLLRVNAATGASKPLLPPGEKTVPTAWTVTRDGTSVIAALPASSLTPYGKNTRSV